MTGSYFWLSALHDPRAMSLISSESLKKESLDIRAYFLLSQLGCQGASCTLIAFTLSHFFISDVRVVGFFFLLSSFEL